MKQSSGSGRRMRGRPNRNKGYGLPNRNSSFESNGPEGRVRGNASQVYEKYLALGREAVASGDRVTGEAFFQHAEHYYRIINDSCDPRPEGAPRPQQPDGRREDHRREDRRMRHNGSGAEAKGGEPPHASQAPAVNSRSSEAAPSPVAEGAAVAPSPERGSGGDNASDAGKEAVQQGRRSQADGQTPAPASAGATVEGELPLEKPAQQNSVPGNEAPARPRRGRPQKKADPAATAQPEDASERPRRGRPRKTKPVEEDRSGSTDAEAPPPASTTLDA